MSLKRISVCLLCFVLVVMLSVGVCANGVDSLTDSADNSLAVSSGMQRSRSFTIVFTYPDGSNTSVNVPSAAYSGSYVSTISFTWATIAGKYRIAIFTRSTLTDGSVHSDTTSHGLFDSMSDFYYNSDFDFITAEGNGTNSLTLTFSNTDTEIFGESINIGVGVSTGSSFSYLAPENWPWNSMDSWDYSDGWQITELSSTWLTDNSGDVTFSTTLNGAFEKSGNRYVSSKTGMISGPPYTETFVDPAIVFPNCVGVNLRGRVNGTLKYTLDDVEYTSTFSPSVQWLYQLWTREPNGGSWVASGQEVVYNISSGSDFRFSRFATSVFSTSDFEDIGITLVAIPEKSLSAPDGAENVEYSFDIVYSFDFTSTLTDSLRTILQSLPSDVFSTPSDPFGDIFSSVTDDPDDLYSKLIDYISLVDNNVFSVIGKILGYSLIRDFLIIVLGLAFIRYVLFN